MQQPNDRPIQESKARVGSLAADEASTSPQRLGSKWCAALGIILLGASTTPALITATGLGSTVTLWLVALVGLLLGLVLGDLLIDPPIVPVLAVVPTDSYRSDDFFGQPSVRMTACPWGSEHQELRP